MSPQHAMQRLIIAGNALCAALEDEHQMPEDDRARVLSTWEVAVESAKNSVPKRAVPLVQVRASEDYTVRL